MGGVGGVVVDCWEGSGEAEVGEDFVSDCSLLGHGGAVGVNKGLATLVDLLFVGRFQVFLDCVDSFGAKESRVAGFGDNLSDDVVVDGDLEDIAKSAKIQREVARRVVSVTNYLVAVHHASHCSNVPLLVERKYNIQAFEQGGFLISGAEGLGGRRGGPGSGEVVDQRDAIDVHIKLKKGLMKGGGELVSWLRFRSSLILVVVAGRQYLYCGDVCGVIFSQHRK